MAENVLNSQINFDSFASKTEREIRSELIQLKGIGNWSIEVYLMFSLQKPDIIPLEDIAIKNTLKELFGSQTKEEMLIISNIGNPLERWLLL